MNINKNYIKKTLYLWGERPEANTVPIQSYDVNNTIVEDHVLEKGVQDIPKDIYINVFLTKTCEIFEYVDVKKDEKIYKIERQLINPYYIEFGFFNTVKRIKVNNEGDLTPVMVNYLMSSYTESINSVVYQGDVYKWFDDIGYNILINNVTTTIDDVTGKKIQENELEKLEKIDADVDSVVSKAYFFPIEINK
ncbi:MAG: hypothetical protein WC466_09065 [Candidatus Izemoplasmatales bacterium]